MASSLAPAEPSLLDCCSCRSWAAVVAARGPYGSLDALIDAAREVWWHQVGGAAPRVGGLPLACRPPLPPPLPHPQTPISGWLEAFAAHPKIGDLEGLRKKYGGAFGDMSRGEQAAAAGAPEAVLQVRLPSGWQSCAEA